MNHGEVDGKGLKKAKLKVGKNRVEKKFKKCCNTISVCTQI